MQSNKISRLAVFFSGIFVNAFSWGIWGWAVYDIYLLGLAIAERAEVIKMNVVGLWIPVGAIGLCLFSLASPGVALITGKRSDAVWGAKGAMIANYIIGFFAVFGVIVAIYLYQSMTSRLEEQGYSYCRALTKFSATGRHEVYVARPELCVKRPRS
jgi:hypothetical protein